MIKVASLEADLDQHHRSEILFWGNLVSGTQSGTLGSLKQWTQKSMEDERDHIITWSGWSAWSKSGIMAQVVNGSS